MEIMVRAAVVYVLLLGLVRALGKRELAEMSAFELLLLVTMGDLVQQGVTQEDMSITGALLAVGTMGLLVVIGSYVSFRWTTVARLLEGSPAEVVRDGQVNRDALQVERLRLDDLIAAARDHGIGDLSTVEVGVLEADGKFSFVLSSPTTTPTPPEERHRS
ncbi:MAG: DUF421 domain-containing protein [Acidimicrobiales bacterium]|nr:DUF421 domain-containing protein [Acidimicrobiales bacterium]